MSLALPAILAIVLYLGSAGGLAIRPPHATPGLRHLALAVATLAVVLHAGVLFGAHSGRLDLHFFAALSLVGCVVAALTLLVNVSRPVAALGVIVFPIAALLLALDAFLAPPTTPLPLDWQISLHVAIALLGYSVLSIAAVIAVLLAVQERALRTHQPTRPLLALPPLVQTESLLFRLIGAGFLLLTLTLLSGALFIQNIRAQHLIHTTVLSVVAWLIFGTLLWGRWKHGWRGRSAVNLCLAGMAVLLLAFFGSKAVLELVLHRVV
ncbi:MAG: inner membrane protein YpjD [Rhodanobacter sp.]|nr:MAG: inner membrane protein YpjD [Rhodanobacter sp.]TAM14552.1 MAG: inner membrane protein YpjD [Rhodanobacter sp.]TAM37344.1 MAG: inner membrane protein YpjD [Rhodanobacter sp.]